MITFELFVAWECAPKVLRYFLRHYMILLLDKLSDYASLVLRFGVVHLADELPYFASETITLNGFETLVEALSDPIEA